MIFAPHAWQVFAAIARLLAAGTGGAALAVWTALAVANTLPAGCTAFAVELRARARQRLRAAEATLAAALITGLFA